MRRRLLWISGALLAIVVSFLVLIFIARPEAPFTFLTDRQPVYRRGASTHYSYQGDWNSLFEAADFELQAKGFQPPVIMKSTMMSATFENPSAEKDVEPWSVELRLNHSIDGRGEEAYAPGWLSISVYGPRPGVLGEVRELLGF